MSERVLRLLQTFPTTIIIDGAELSPEGVTRIYARGRGLGDEGPRRREAAVELAEGLGLAPDRVDDAALDDFLAFVDDKWAQDPPAQIRPGKHREIEISGFKSDDNPVGVHRDCAGIFQGGKPVIGPVD